MLGLAIRQIFQILTKIRLKMRINPWIADSCFLRIFGLWILAVFLNLFFKNSSPYSGLLKPLLNLT